MGGSEWLTSIPRSHNFDSKLFSSVNDFLEHVIIKESGGEKLPPKHLGDVLIDDKTLIDVKSVNVSKKYHMPNLASQKKLLDWLSDKDNTLKYLFIFYEKIDDIIHIRDIELRDIEEINPECLIVQAQGLGVMQIKDIKKLSFVKKIDRESWLLNVLKPKVSEANEMIDVPIMYGNEERWAAVRKRGIIRDKNDSLILPLLYYVDIYLLSNSFFFS